MKCALLIFLLVFSSSMSFGQDEDAWRDSLMLARKAYENKNYSEALKRYESAQKIAPDDIDLSDEMAQSAYKARDFERAEKIYQQGSGSKMSKSERADAMHNMGNAQMRQENYEGAIESYKEALRLNPNDEETRYNLSKAIRKVKEKRTPPPPKQDEQDPQDQQDQNQNDGGDDQQSGQGDKQQNNQGNKQNQGNNNQNNQNQSGQGGGSDDSKGKLSNQAVERKLDEIAKKEAETKREMMGAGKGGRSAKSGKDW